MQITFLTLFPEMFTSPLTSSILRRAQEKEKVEFNLINIRDFTSDKHKTVDAPPYGGGPGMVMMVEPIHKALQKIQYSINNNQQKRKTILLSAKGKLFTQELARDYAKLDQLILICGHYEGVDERVTQHLVDEEVRIGDYVLTGGELPAMVIADAVTRLLPGVLGDDMSNVNESHSLRGVLEHPQYTRPANYRGWEVPEVLQSGDHGKIASWRASESKSTTEI